MAYNLGAVKSHVREAAELVGPKFGIKTIGGWGPGSIPGSDHPKGLALDFMTNNISNGKTKGDALTSYVIHNAKALNITYVIWYRRIWQNGNWSPYTGTSNPHTDHVHVSFKGSGDVGDTSLPGRSRQLEGPNLSAFSGVTKPDTWLRIAYGILGVVLIGFALSTTGLKLGIKELLNSGQ